MQTVEGLFGLIFFFCLSLLICNKENNKYNCFFTYNYVTVVLHSRKTAKSKKKIVNSGDCNTNGASSVESSLPKCDKSAKCESQAQVKQVNV